MSLKSLLALISDELETVFHRKEPDAAKARAKALKTIETARKQFASVQPTRGKKSFKVANEVVAFTPGYAINGKLTNYVPAERFGTDFLTNLEKAINSGEMDEALLAHEKGEAAVVEKKVSKPRKERTAEQKAETAAKRAKTFAERGIRPGRAKKAA